MTHVVWLTDELIQYVCIILCTLWVVRKVQMSEPLAIKMMTVECVYKIIDGLATGCRV